MSAARAPRGALLLALGLAASACSLLHFPETAAVVTCPARDNEVLDEGECPRVIFPFAVDPSSVEAIFTVRSAQGAVTGCYRWADHAVSFHPEPELIRGARYVLCLQGVFNDAQGTACSIDRLVPFFWASEPQPPPYVEWTDPAPGQTIGPGAAVRLRFSEDVDPLTVAAALRLSPETETEQSWEDGTRQLLLAPVPSWKNLTVYTLRVGTGLCDLAGTPLCQELQLVFLVQEDITCPTVLAVSPAFNDAQLLYLETGAELASGVGPTDALRVRFSEAMDRSATAEALALSPAVGGSLLWLDDSTLVFSPLGGYAPGTSYLLSFGPSAVDLAGNPLAGARSVSFTPAAQEISVCTDLVYDGVRIEPGQYSTVAAREIRVSAAHGQYEFVFEFTGGHFDEDGEKAAVQECIRLDCLFPLSGASDPWPLGYSWTADDRLSVTYAGLGVSTPAQSYYYLLSLRGGESGVQSSEGNRMEEDVEQLLTTVDRGP